MTKQHIWCDRPDVMYSNQKYKCEVFFHMIDLYHLFSLEWVVMNNSFLYNPFIMMKLFTFIYKHCKKHNISLPDVFCDHLFCVNKY